VADYLDPIMSDIFNWAIYTTGYVLNYHKRALQYNEYSSSNQVLMGVAGFIQDKLVYDPDPLAFTSIPEICSLLEEYVEETGDTSVLKLLTRLQLNVTLIPRLILFSVRQ
jgi:hypothetical protein